MIVIKVFSDMTQLWQDSFSHRHSHLMASPAVCALSLKGIMAIVCVKYTNTAKRPTP
jgi:hypothetical protein